MGDAKASVFNAEISELKVELGDAAKHGLTAFELFMAYVAPKRTRLLKRIAREEGLKDAAVEEKKRLMRVEGDVRELRMLTEAEHELLQQSVLRLGIRGIIREQNLLNIAEKLKEMGPQLIAKEPVSEQVMLDILDNCQDESDEFMQTYWAKLIRGEVAQPGSFSPKTRSVLKSLRKEDAELFTKFCGFVWGVSPTANYFVPSVRSITFEAQFIDFSITHRDYVTEAIPYFWQLHLESLGLVKLHTQLINHSEVVSPGSPVLLYFHGREHTISVQDSPKTLQYEMDMLTSAGLELFPICGPTPHEEFRQQFVTELRRNGLTVED